jgi:hypothetical protein
MYVKWLMLVQTWSRLRIRDGVLKVFVQGWEKVVDSRRNERLYAPHKHKTSSTKSSEAVELNIENISFRLNSKLISGSLLANDEEMRLNDRWDAVSPTKSFFRHWSLVHAH